MLTTRLSGEYVGVLLYYSIFFKFCNKKLKKEGSHI